MSTDYNYFDLPRVIRVDSEERTRNYKWAEKSKNLDRQVRICTIEELRANPNINLPKRLVNGDVLILHPYETNQYINIEECDNLRISKFKHFCAIAQKLGAKSYKLSWGEYKSGESTIDASGKVGSPKWGKGGVDIKKKEQFEEKTGFRLEDSFDGVRIISEESFVKAKELAAKYNLENDDDIKLLLEKRDPSNENHQHNEHVHCEVSKEINSELDAALSIDAVGIFDLSANVKLTMKKRESIVVDIEFEFPSE